MVISQKVGFCCQRCLGYCGLQALGYCVADSKVYSAINVQHAKLQSLSPFFRKVCKQHLQALMAVKVCDAFAKLSQVGLDSNVKRRNYLDGYHIGLFLTY